MACGCKARGTVRYPKRPMKMKLPTRKMTPVFSYQISGTIKISSEFSIHNAWDVDVEEVHQLQQELNNYQHQE